MRVSHAFEAVALNGKTCLQHIVKQIRNSDTRATFKPQIQTLLQAKVNHKKIADPFFKLETVYLDYIAGFQPADASPIYPGRCPGLLYNRPSV